MNRYQNLIDKLVNEEYIFTREIIDAFKSTPRKEFVTESRKFLANINSPLPIGQKQTISQPAVVAIMLELLDPKPGDKVLEIGYGSGWQTSMLAKLIHSNEKEPGCLFAYEILPEIAEFGRKNVEAHLDSDVRECVRLFDYDFTNTFKKFAPYDKIIAAAAFEKTPDELIKALKIGGCIVYPSSNRDIRKITRTDKGTYNEDVYPGFVFVPITHSSKKKSPDTKEHS